MEGEVLDFLFCTVLKVLRLQTHKDKALTLQGERDTSLNHPGVIGCNTHVAAGVLTL